MQHESLINKPIPRLIIGFIAGIAFRFPYDVIIGLSYKNYTVEAYITYYSLSVISSIVLFQFYHFINQRLDKKYQWRETTKKRFWFQLIAQICLGLFVMLLLRYTFTYIIFRLNFYVLKIEILSAVVIVLTIVVYHFIEYGFYLLNNSRHSLAELERFKKENAEFRFETLMSQVNPHFLFNSLNTLSSLVYEDQATASQYIRELARVYRYVLENKQHELIGLKVDLDFVKAYIFLLELRFKDMIRFNFDIEEKQFDKLIAPMTIQMLIENAVKHNIVSQKKQLFIKLYTENDYLVVSNNIQKKPAIKDSTGLGLSNIRSRYAYFTDNRIDILENDTDFLVKIPLIKAKK